MRLRLIGSVMVALAILVAGCSSAPTEKAFGKEDQEAIKKLVQDFVTAYNAKDVAKVGALFAPNTVLMPANRNTLRGIDLVSGYYTERFSAGVHDLTMETHDVTGHGPLGYVTATFSLKITPPDGAAERSDRGKVLWIVHNYGGQWKFEYQIMSSDLPPEIPAPAPAEAAAAKK